MALTATTEKYLHDRREKVRTRMAQLMATGIRKGKAVAMLAIELDVSTGTIANDLKKCQL